MGQSCMSDEEIIEERFALFKMQIFFWPINKDSPCEQSLFNRKKMLCLQVHKN